jgi:hypothetical protein
MGVRMVATDGPVASVVVEGGIADSDIEMAVGDVLGPANSEAQPADMLRDLGQADRNQPAFLEEADMTAAAPNNDMIVDPVAEEGRDGELGQALPSIDATPTDVLMEAGQADVDVSMSQAPGGGQLGSLEDGEVPEDHLGPSRCMSPPAQAADPSL